MALIYIKINVGVLLEVLPRSEIWSIGLRANSFLGIHLSVTMRLKRLVPFQDTRGTASLRDQAAQPSDPGHDNHATKRAIPEPKNTNRA